MKALFYFSISLIVLALVTACPGHSSSAATPSTKTTVPTPVTPVKTPVVIPSLIQSVAPSDTITFTYKQKVDCGIIGKTISGAIKIPPSEEIVFLDQMTFTVPDSNGVVKIGRECYLLKN